MSFPPHKAPDSGAQGLIGYEIDLTAPDGTARVVLDVEARHMNRVGSLHGGIHCMMLDAAAGFAASRHLAAGGPEIVPVITLSLTTAYIGPGGTGQVTARGWVTGGGYKIVHAEAEICDAQGQVLSRGQGVFKRTKE